MAGGDSQKRVVLVTGSSRGLGLAIASQILSYTASKKGESTLVVGCGRSEQPDVRRFFETQVSPHVGGVNERVLRLAPGTYETLEAFEGLFRSSNFEYRQLDIAEEGSIEGLVADLTSKYGGVDAVVHNAGTIDPMARIADIPLDELHRAWDCNVLSTVRIAKSSISAMNMRMDTNTKGVKRCGSFVVVSSGASTKAYPGWGAYCLSKAACNSIVASVAAEETTLNALSIRPGVVDTDMQVHIRASGSNAMGGAHERFVNLHKDGLLQHPCGPAATYSALAILSAEKVGELLEKEGVKQGSFCSWDDPQMATIVSTVFNN